MLHNDALRTAVESWHWIEDIQQLCFSSPVQEPALARNSTIRRLIWKARMNELIKWYIQAHRMHPTAYTCRLSHPRLKPMHGKRRPYQLNIKDRSSGASPAREIPPRKKLSEKSRAG
jgi:hypothetical protein